MNNEIVTLNFKKAQVNNLMLFLDRVEVKGFTELQAMNEILSILNPPKVEEV